MSPCHTSSSLMHQDCFNAQARQLLTYSNLLLSATVMKNKWKWVFQWNFWWLNPIVLGRRLCQCVLIQQIADHVQGAFGNKLLKTFLSVWKTVHILLSSMISQQAYVWNAVVNKNADSGCCQVNILYTVFFNMQVVDRRIWSKTSSTGQRNRV